MRHLLLIGLLLYMTTAPKAGEPGFQGTSWGMTRAEIQELEGSSPAQTGDFVLIYPEQFSGITAQVFYYFHPRGDYLTQSHCIATEEHLSRKEYLLDYRVWRDVLCMRYGEPMFDAIPSLEEWERHSPGRLNQVLNAAYFDYSTRWETGDSIITLTLQGRDGTVQLSILNQSKTLLSQR